MDARTIDRALGAFAGVALGDAMGMPTQTLSRERIAALYGDVTDFRDAALGQPVCAGLRPPPSPTTWNRAVAGKPSGGQEWSFRRGSLGANIADLGA